MNAAVRRAALHLQGQVQAVVVDVVIRNSLRAHNHVAHRGARDWKTLQHAVALASDRHTLYAAMAPLPHAVLRRSRGKREPSLTGTSLYLLAHVPGEAIEREVEELLQDLRTAAQESSDFNDALMWADLACFIQQDPGLRRSRAACWRRHGTGWRLTAKVEEAVSRLPRTSPCRDALEELNSIEHHTTDGYPLGPALVSEGGKLHREVDRTRPRLDLAAQRREQEAQMREYAEAMRRIRERRRSKAATSGHTNPSGSNP